MHAKVNVEFSVEGVGRTVPSVIGVRQGDLLGPIFGASQARVLGDR
jgi:hypothetical protein